MTESDQDGSADDVGAAWRLSRITTIWTVVSAAHAEEQDLRQQAVNQLMERYHRAVYRYLLGALRNADAADELFQEFAVRIVRGRFRNAAPERGRFRSFLKVALQNMVTDYFRQRARHPERSLPEEIAEAAAEGGSSGDSHFVAAWREELLARSWRRLRDEQQAGGHPYYAVLRYRSMHPSAKSAAIAEHLKTAAGLEQAPSSATVRKTLQRARLRFAELLVDEVAGSISENRADEIERELIELQLLPYCRQVIGRRHGSG